MKPLSEMTVEELRVWAMLMLAEAPGYADSLQAFDELADRLKAAQRCPEGWVCVPRKQTFAMWEDMHDALVRYCVDGKTVEEAWDAAIKASPKIKETEI